MNVLEKLLYRTEEGKKLAIQNLAKQRYQVCEKNGKLWVTFDGAPVVPEDMLNGDIREITNKLRKKYVEENLRID